MLQFEEAKEDVKELVDFLKDPAKFIKLEENSTRHFDGWPPEQVKHFSKSSCR